MDLQKRFEDLLATRQRRNPSPRTTKVRPRLSLEFVEEPDSDVLSYDNFVSNVLNYIADVFSKVFLATATLEEANLNSLADLKDVQEVLENICNDETIVQKHVQILENVLKLIAARTKNRNSLALKEQKLFFVRKRLFFLSREIRSLKSRESLLKDTCKLSGETGGKGETATRRAFSGLLTRSLKQNNRMIAEYNDSIQKEQNELALGFQQEPTDNKELEQIERTIGHINSLYNKLAEIVAMQNDHFDRIDENIDLAVENTEAAAGDLDRILKSMKENRWFMLKAGGAAVAMGALIYYFI